MSVSHLVPLTKPAPLVDPGVVSLLEDMLEQARAGRFNAVAIATLCSPAPGVADDCGTAFAGAGAEQCVFAMLGCLEQLKHRWHMAKIASQ